MLLRMQIDRLNLEGYANRDHWVGELDKRIEAILLHRLTQIIHVWCLEFDGTDDGGTRRDSHTGKRRRDKRMKDEKVRECLMVWDPPLTNIVYSPSSIIWFSSPLSTKSRDRTK
jgi:hypothetical protein